MKINITLSNGISIAEIQSEEVELKDVGTALDLIGNCGYQGANIIILQKSNIIPEFFDLKNGIAGEILQKFSTYDFQLFIVGDFSAYTSKSIQDFIRESNRIGRINFVSSWKEAKERCTK